MACHGSDVFFNEIRGDAMNRHIRPAPAPLAGGCTEFGPLRSLRGNASGATFSSRADHGLYVPIEETVFKLPG